MLVWKTYFGTAPKAVRKNNFSNSFGNDQECLFFQGSVCYRPGTIAEVIFAHCLSG